MPHLLLGMRVWADDSLGPGETVASGSPRGNRSKSGQPTVESQTRQALAPCPSSPVSSPRARSTARGARRCPSGGSRARSRGVAPGLPRHGADARRLPAGQWRPIRFLVQLPAGHPPPGLPCGRSTRPGPAAHPRGHDRRKPRPLGRGLLAERLRYRVPSRRNALRDRRPRGPGRARRRADRAVLVGRVDASSHPQSSDHCPVEGDAPRLGVLVGR